MGKEERIYTISGEVAYVDGKIKEKKISTTFREKKEKKAAKAFEQFIKEISKEKYIGRMELTISRDGVDLKKVIVNKEEK